jgi:prepilin-type N-terminal cleavage/methylation domain-containing protein
MKKNSRGMTLIELLVVTSIVIVILFAAYAFLNSGIKIWQRVNRSIPEEDVNIFFEKFTHDVRNMVKFSNIPFVGTADHCEWATLVVSSNLRKTSIGKLVYSFDPQDKIIKRMQSDYSQIFTQEKKIINQVLPHLKSMKFKYYIRYKEATNRLWLEECPSGVLPLAVRIELEFNDGTNNKVYGRTVALPLGA